jgi:peptide/nickel transport system substrate-binding protein
MNVTRRELLKGAAALGVAGALPGAMPTSAQAQTTQKRELVVAQGGDIAKFDPHFSTASNEIRWSFNVFDNLTSRHPDGKLHPGLATEWKLQGQTTWAFKLRQGVKYHNGDPFTSADAKYSIERTYDPAAKTMVATALSTIDRIEAPDPYSLLIHTKKPDPLLPARLGFYGGQIVPKKYLESVGADAFNTKPVGTGPVRLTSWVKDDKAVFDAYPDYWRQDRHGPARRARHPRDGAPHRRAAQGRGGHHHPAAARSGRAHHGESVNARDGRALRGSLRAGGEQQAAAPG